MVIVGANFGKTGENIADVNGDGVVNIVDLVKVAGAFGQTAAAPSLPPIVGNNDRYSLLTAADVEGWLTQARGLTLRTWRCKGDCCLRTPLGCVDTERDRAIAELSKSV